MNTIEKIRAEIERRKKALHSTLFNDEYNDLLSFLSTLENDLEYELDFAKQLAKIRESERKANLDELIDFWWEQEPKNKELFIRAIKKAYFVGKAQRDTLESEKPNDLDEAADTYASDGTGFIDMTAFRAFIAGAEWMKKQLLP